MSLSGFRIIVVLNPNYKRFLGNRSKHFEWANDMIWLMFK